MQPRAKTAPQIKQTVQKEASVKLQKSWCVCVSPQLYKRRLQAVQRCMGQRQGCHHVLQETHQQLAILLLYRCMSVTNLLKINILTHGTEIKTHAAAWHKHGGPKPLKGNEWLITDILEIYCAGRHSVWLRLYTGFRKSLFRKVFSCRLLFVCSVPFFFLPGYNKSALRWHRWGLWLWWECRSQLKHLREEAQNTTSESSVPSFFM